MSKSIQEISNKALNVRYGCMWFSIKQEKNPSQEMLAAFAELEAERNKRIKEYAAK